MYKNVQGAESKSAKPSTSPSPTKQDPTKQLAENEEKQTVVEKLQQLSLDETQSKKIPTSQSLEHSSKSTFTDELSVGIEERDKLQTTNHDTSFKDVEQPTTNVEEQEEMAVGEEEGGENDGQEELKAKVEVTEQQLLERFDRIQRESQETQETIKKLTSYVKVLNTTSDEIDPMHEGVSPQPETQGVVGDGTVTGDSATMMVGSVDPIAQAALLASMKERVATTTSVDSQEETTGEVMEPVQVSEMDTSNIVVVGEIMGPQVGASKSPLEEESRSTTAVDTKLEPEDDKLSATPAPPETEPSQLQQGGGVAPAAAAVVGSSSKKPKRQLAASFMNVAKE